MKKVYLLITALIVNISCFATAWKTNAAGAANTLANWRDVATGLITPTTFATSGDTWNIQNNMTIGAVTWNLGGTLTATSGHLATQAAGAATINIGGNLSMSGAVYFGTTTTGSDLTINLSGNLSISGTARFVNTPAFNYIYFAGTSSTLASPQTFSNTSTSTTSSWTYYYVNTGCVAEMTGNFPMHTDGLFTVNGTLVCQTYVMSDDGTCPFTLSSGASLYTANTSGINGSITVSSTTFNSAANYYFNGSAAQVTGTDLPTALVAPSVLGINNSAGVTLSQATSTTGTLAFTSGTLSTGGTSITVPGTSGAVTGAGATSYVIGNLIKTITGLTSVNYEVGDLDYSPMNLVFSASASGGTIGVQTTSGLHPAVGTSGLSSTAMVNKYWTITSTGASGPTSVTPTVTYNSGDILGGSNATFATQKYTSSAWLSSALSTVNTSTPYTSTPVAIGFTSIAGDYIFGNPPPCTGTPTAGTANISPVSGIGTTPFLLTLTGSTSAVGLSYQWQSSPTGLAGSWVNIGGATSATYAFTGITENTYFRCYVTCPTYATDTSTNTFALFMACTPVAGSTSWTNSGTVTKSYTGAAQTYTVPAGVTSLAVDMSGAAGGDSYQSGSEGPGSNGGRVQCNLTVTPGATLNIYVGGIGNNWSGTISEPGGYNGGGASGTYAASGGGATDIRIGGAALSNRVVVAGGGGGGGDFDTPGGAGGGLTGGAGGNYGSGAACGGGQSGPSCTTGLVLGTLGNGGGTASYSYGGGGGGYWGGNAGTADGGGGGGSSYTSSTLCSSVLHTQGYSAATGNGTVTLSYILNVTSNGINNLYISGASGTSLSDAGISAAVGSLSGYVSHTSLSPVTMLQGGTYATTATWGTALSYQEVQIWIDFNDDAIYESSEEVTTVQGYSATATPNPTTFNITIPSGANLGTHLMRMRGIQEDPAHTLSLSTHLDPCLSSYGGVAPYYLNGDAVDYYVTISPNLCTGTPTAGTVAATTTTGCSSYTSTLSLTGASVGGGLAYQWETSSDGVTWTPVAGATASTYAATVTATIYYECVVICTSTSLSATTPAFLLTLPVIGPITPGTPDSVCVSSTIAFSDTTGGGLWSSSASGTASVNPSTGLVTGVATGTATITYTASGCHVTQLVSVDGAPAAIGGTASICASGTGTLTDATAGGTWSTTATTVVSVDPVAGVITGIGGGTGIVTYTTLCGSSTITVTVTTAPAGITGTLNVCVGSATSLADATPGGTWTSLATGVATVNPTGVVTGMSSGTATIDYATTCGTTTVVVTVNGTPASITGSATVCVGSVTTLADGTAGGSWSTTGTFVSVDGSGDVSGLGQGTQVVSYSNGCGTPAMVTVTVNAVPASITGTMTLCVGSTTSLFNTSTGGTWTATGSATVDPVSGVVTGISGGTAIITYANTCGSAATATVTVTAAPAAIAGSATSVCVGSVISFSDAVTGGIWTSGATGVATVDLSGNVTGIASGTANISYSTGCGSDVAVNITVNPLPSVITGTLSLCGSGTSTLSDSVSGGTWSSSLLGVASIDPVTGVVTPVGVGVTTIDYVTICGTATVGVTVNTVPPDPISGSATSVCANSAISFTDGVSGGAWTSSATSIATVDPSGNVTGIAGGTATITYSTGCGTPATISITVLPLPAAIGGATSVCVGSTATATNSVSGGTWTSDGIYTSIDPSSGMATGLLQGVSTITYSNTCGSVTSTMTVNGAPAAITGASTVCVSSSIPLTETATGGSWSSSDITIATVDPLLGTVTGAGQGVSTITYSNSCGTDATTMVTVYAAPAPISGITTLCGGGTTTLSDASTGGTWSSSATGIATVDPTGVVTTFTSGTVNISYSTGCGTDVSTTLTLNGGPTAISGSSSVCIGSVTTLTDGISGGTWTSGATGIATVDPVSGVVGGISLGTANITYSTGCGTDVTFSIASGNTPNPITGSPTVCTGATATATDATGGGTWSSSATGTATIDPVTGVMTGITAGTVTIDYTTTCGAITTNITVNQATAPITGTSVICATGSTLLSDTTSGGTWSCSTPLVANIAPSGLLSGVGAGLAIVTYNAPVCGPQTYAVTVNGAPAPIAGSSPICISGTLSLTDDTTGGAWSSGATATASVDPVSGIVTGISAGTVNIQYTTTCGVATAVVTVNGAPAAIVGAGSVCSGGSSIVSCTTSGGTWSASSGLVTIDGSGNILSVGCGVVTISYTTTCGSATMPFTVNCVPGAIAGSASSVCVFSTLMLTDGTSGGTWSNTTGNATVDPVSGVVTGALAGTDVINYTTGCGSSATYPVTVVAAPAAISGVDSACAGGSTLLADAVTGGVWSGGSTSIATINAVTGSVSAIGAGSVTFIYSTGCGTDQTFPVTVNPLPAPISGLASMCQFSTITLSETGSGSWVGSSSSIATVDPSLGTVTGIGFGVDTVTFSLVVGGCSTTTEITVNAFPNAGVIIGPSTVCFGDSVLMTDAADSGSWTSSNPSIASVNASGRVMGNGVGSTNINYVVSNGCGTATSHKSVTVNPLPSAGTISGGSNLCIGATLSLTDGAMGGAWSSASTGIATVNAATGLVGGIASGSDSVFYTVTTACGTAKVGTQINVLSVPSAITGATSVCVGSVVTLTDATTMGTWSSSDLGTAIISGTGVITPVTAGMVTITYSTGCGAPATVSFTVNPLAVAGTISGATMVCQGSSITLTDGTTGGSWSSSNTAATVTGGIVTGSTSGADTIIYAVTNMCNTAITTYAITVNALPVAGILTGSDSVCVGATTTIASTATGGTWTMSNVAGTVAGGVVTGAAAGMDTVIYTVTSPFCGSATASMGMTVVALPVSGTITGASSVCQDASITLADTAPGGSWSSSSGTTATVAGGVVSGVNAGTVTITYSVMNYCGTSNATANITVNPLVSAGTISGMDSVCIGMTVTLTDPVSGGSWSSFDTTIATAGATTGVVTGRMNGVDTIYYTVSNVCNSAYVGQMVYVRPIPTFGTFTGDSAVCVGNTLTLSSTVGGGTWTSTATNITISGDVVTASGAGTAPVVYTVGTPCGMVSGTVNISVDTTVHPMISGKPFICLGSRDHVDTLTGTPSGGIWATSDAGDSVTAAGWMYGNDTGAITVSYSITNGCGTSTGTATVDVYSKAVCDSILVVPTVGGSKDGVIMVFPNPSTGSFTVELPENAVNSDIEIMDMYGKIIQTRKISNGAERMVEFSMDNVANGTYMIRATADDIHYTGRIVIMNR